MKHRYSISGMTCDACAETVRKALLGHPEVTEVEVRRNPPEATVEMQSHVSSDELAKRVRASGNYNLKAVDEQALAHDSEEGDENTKSWWETYKPVLILAMLLTLASLAVAWQANDDPLAAGMRTFMAGFFFVFGYQEMLMALKDLVQRTIQLLVCRLDRSASLIRQRSTANIQSLLQDI